MKEHFPGSVNKSTYLAEILRQLRCEWPNNRTINIVCHGHSVPAGYFLTPKVNALESYPNLLRVALSAQFPHAVFNVIVTAIGGENAEDGSKRFERDVLRLRPDLVLLDYALNDRKIGLERAWAAWATMIEFATREGSKMLLFTPTADLSVRRNDRGEQLNQHAVQIRNLASKYAVGLVDSSLAFSRFEQSGGKIEELMAQENHPNGSGHELVAKSIIEWFR